jgi:hypothetical protein
MTWHICLVLQRPWRWKDPAVQFGKQTLSQNLGRWKIGSFVPRQTSDLLMTTVTLNP